MSYQVYHIAEMGMPRDHHAIFVETHEDGPGSGHKYHVIGNIQAGMTFEHRTELPPDRLVGLCAKGSLGVVTNDNYGRFLAVCESVPVPKKQFEGGRRLYPHEPLRRCLEWAEDAIRGLRDAEVLQCA